MTRSPAHEPYPTTFAHLCTESRGLRHRIGPAVMTPHLRGAIDLASSWQLSARTSPGRVQWLLDCDVSRQGRDWKAAARWHHRGLTSGSIPGRVVATDIADVTLPFPHLDFTLLARRSGPADQEPRTTEVPTAGRDVKSCHVNATFLAAADGDTITAQHIRRGIRRRLEAFGRVWTGQTIHSEVKP